MGSAVGTEELLAFALASAFGAVAFAFALVMAIDASLGRGGRGFCHRAAVEARRQARLARFLAAHVDFVKVLAPVKVLSK